MINFSANYINVLSTPRTGSVWFSHLLFQYCKDVHGFTQLLTEPFNTFHYNLWYEDFVGGRKNHRTWAPERYRITLESDRGHVRTLKSTFPTCPPPVPSMFETSGRIQEIKQATKLVMHNHVEPLDLEAFNFLMEYPCILVGRKDKWEQLLSYGVAYHTKVFARFEGGSQTIPQPGEITFPDDVAIGLLYRIKRFEEIRKQYTFPMIWYEDVDFDHPEITLREHLGINWKPTAPLRLPLKQTPGDKEQYFNNLDKLKELYVRILGNNHV